MQRDIVEFDIHYEEKKNHVDRRVKGKKRRRTKSFDENVMRELYDDFGAESDFSSQLSWISFPMRSSYQADPYMLARTALFTEKLKYKYQYNNVYAHIKDELVPNRQKDCVAVRT